MSDQTLATGLWYGMRLTVLHVFVIPQTQSQ